MASGSTKQCSHILPVRQCMTCKTLDPMVSQPLASAVLRHIGPTLTVDTCTGQELTSEVMIMPLLTPKLRRFMCRSAMLGPQNIGLSSTSSLAQPKETAASCS